MDLTLFINSCDAYSDCWGPFFTLLKKYWRDIDLPIILNTETKIYYDKDLEIICPIVEKTSGHKLNWGERFLKSLEYVKTKYVLLILDDFFIMDYVDVGQINYFLDLMKTDDISHILLCEAPGPNLNSKYNSLMERGKEVPYRFSLQVGIWNKNILGKYIRKHESPWDTEIWATKRSWKLKDDFFCIKSEKDKPIKYFDTGVIARGKWMKNKVLNFFEKENIKIDFSKRGFYSPVRRTLKQRIINRTKNFPNEFKSRLSVFFLKNKLY